MVAFTTCALVLAAAGSAFSQSLSNPVTSFKPGTGVRSLWIPFQTASSVQASILDVNTKINETTYVISCPTSAPQCALAPNVTLTEGPTHAEYVTSNTAGAATVNCALNNTLPIVCHQIGRQKGNNDVQKVSTTLTAASQILFQEVTVTGTMNATSGATSKTKKSSTTSSTTSSTSTSKAGMPTVTAGPWAMGGAAAAGLMALAAL